jgi:hypothetical protein
VANHVLAILSKAFNLVELWGLRPEGSNPCRRVRRYRENARERFLTGDNLARLRQALDEAETTGHPGDRATEPRRSSGPGSPARAQG